MVTDINRIKLLIKLSMVKGPVFIFCILRVIQLVKQMLALELEQGLEVRIPEEICQTKLP